MSSPFILTNLTILGGHFSDAERYGWGNLRLSNTFCATDGKYENNDIRRFLSFGRTYSFPDARKFLEPRVMSLLTCPSSNDLEQAA
jgi:hypothetical protein